MRKSTLRTPARRALFRLLCGARTPARRRPARQQPDFPILDTYDIPGYQLVARRPTLWECNWLQVKENCMDPAHLAFLHTLPGSLLSEGARVAGRRPQRGMVNDTRRSRRRVGVRIADFILPNIHRFRPTRTRSRCATLSTARRRRPGRSARRHAYDADRLLPRARGQDAARPAARMKSASASPGGATPRSASSASWPATGSWRPPTAASR